MKATVSREEQGMAGESIKISIFFNWIFIGITNRLGYASHQGYVMLMLIINGAKDG